MARWYDRPKSDEGWGVNVGRESSPVGDAAALPRASRRSNRFLRLGAALVTCAVLVSGLFLGRSFLTGPASSTAPISFQPSPTPGRQASATATSAVSGPTISGVDRFDKTSGLIFLSDGKRDYVSTTKDGGSTWSDLRPMPSGGRKLDAYFVDIDHGWRAYDISAGTLKLGRTTDGGKTWQEASVEFPAGNQLPTSVYIQGSVHFRDRSNGVLLLTYAEGLVGGADPPTWPPYFCGEFTTSDGVVTWAAPSAGRCLLGPTFISDLVGYAGIRDETWGNSPPSPAVMAMTTDGGGTWTDAQLPRDWVPHGWSTQILFMQRRSDGTLRALCSCGPQDQVGLFMNPSVISSNDGGRTWALVREFWLRGHRRVGWRGQRGSLALQQRSFEHARGQRGRRLEMAATRSGRAARRRPSGQGFEVVERLVADVDRHLSHDRPS